MSFKTLNIIVLSLCTTGLYAQENTLRADQEECYAAAMIGYDYVINSRVGLPLQNAISTVSINNDSRTIRDTYKYQLKDIVYNAYLWEESPHTYATTVMYNCAFNKGQNTISH